MTTITKSLKRCQALGNIKVVNVSLADIADEKNLPAKFEKQKLKKY